MNAHPHILVDARPLVDPAGGGVQRAATQVLVQLLQDRPDATYTFMTTGARCHTLPEPFRSHPRVIHLHLQWPNKLWTLASLIGIVALDRAATRISKQTYDAVLLCNLGFTGFIEASYALVLHDFSFRIHPSWFTRKMQLWHLMVNPDELIRRAHRLFCVSHITAMDAERFYDAPKDRCDIIRLAASTHPVHAALTPPDKGVGGFLPTSRFILVLGVGDPRKNTATAIAAIRSLRKNPTFADVQLVMVGELHPNRTFSKRQLATKDHDWITHLPRVSDEDLHALYQRASTILYPSWYDGFGLPLHEAAQYHTPCIASSTGSLPETAPRGTVFVHPAKPHLWTQAIRSTLESPEHHQTTPHPNASKPDIAAILKWMDRVGTSKSPDKGI
ncbi:MAG: glycosyltransferase family 4 protein [Candidatus Uhrbacteria bacterium]|nr:glycosyltransferase family 4 protein [Candidatus Uhrbacteria bacterium]